MNVMVPSTTAHAETYAETQNKRESESGHGVTVIANLLWASVMTEERAATLPTLRRQKRPLARSHLVALMMTLPTTVSDSPCTFASRLSR